MRALDARLRRQAGDRPPSAAFGFDGIHSPTNGGSGRSITESFGADRNRRGD